VCPAPVVEGAISAAVQASMGNDLQTACNEARQALLPKLEHLGADIGGEALHAIAEIETGTADEVTLEIHNTYGLHARPAAQFVKTASQFDAQIQVSNLTNGKGPVTAKSMNAVATLGAVQGHRIRITAAGLQAKQALASLKKLVEDNFGESSEPVAAIQVPPVTQFQALSEKDRIGGAQGAIPISEGIAMGPAYHYHLAPPPVPKYIPSDPQVEWTHLEGAISQTKLSIQEQRRQTRKSAGETQASIFDAHLLILEDPDLISAVKSAIFDTHQNAAFAWHQQISQVAEQYGALEDAYMKQRAVDVMDVGNQVLYSLAGERAVAEIKLAQPVILIAEELTPTQTAQFDLNQVRGILTRSGGPTSHSAILARSLGIPAISGIPESVTTLPEGTQIALDGFRGLYWISPAPETQKELEEKRGEWLSERERLLKASRQPAVTVDGHPIEVVANVGNLKDAETAVQNNAEGIGLLRTEFLFLTRQTPPDEEEQVKALSDIASRLKPYPVIVRTLDVGGDKPLPYIDLPPEANPFLGVRAIRMSFQKPDLFQTQLRAILRSAEQTNIRVMFPMISGVDEVRQARSALLEAHRSLEKAGIPHRYPIETGIMVEIPSSALLAQVLASEVDFFSIGTNDLTQYTLAAERGNPALSELSDALHPAVLNLIDMVIKAAHSHAKWVGVCGELAGDVMAVPILTGLGVDELSMNATAIPRVKELIRKLDLSKARELAQTVLTTEDSQAARQLARQYIQALAS
jgi:phosphoenolpyruvate-protein phosphotransferase